MKRILLTLFFLPILANAQKTNITTQGSATQTINQQSLIYQDIALKVYSTPPTRYAIDPQTHDTVKTDFWKDTSGNIMTWDANSMPIVLATSKTGTFNGTISEARLKAHGFSTVITTDYGGGVWYLNSNDNTSVDDTVTVFVTSQGERYYRIIENYLNYSWFGGISSNIVNQSALIKRALQKAISLKKTLFFNAGTYLCAIKLDGYTGISIDGDKNAILKMPDSLNSSILKFLNCSDVSVKNISFDGNAINNPTREAADTLETNANDDIYVSKGKNINISYTKHRNSVGNGVNLYRVSNYHVDYNRFDTCNRLDQNAITAQFAFTNETVRDNGGSISFNEINYNPKGFGMSFFSSHGGIVEGNVVKDCLVGIASEWSGSNNRLVNNYTNNCKTGAIVTGRPDLTTNGMNNLVSGNRFIDCDTGAATGAVLLAEQRSLGFSNNIVTGKAGNYQRGIYILQCINSIISGNIVTGFGRDGIAAVSSSVQNSQNIYSGNDVYKNGDNGIYLTAEDRSLITNNLVHENVSSGIKLQGCAKTTVSNNSIFDAQATPTQAYGIISQDCDGINFSGNTFSFNKFQPDINMVGTNTKAFNTNTINFERNYATSSPGGGGQSWQKGDVVFNSSPALGLPLRWVCTVAGTPGTWIADGTPVLSITTTIDFSSVSANAQLAAPSTVTLTGAVVGDAINVSAPNTDGIIYKAVVTSSNTITVYACNFTTGAIDPASGTFKFVILR